MKCRDKAVHGAGHFVAPFTGAWIEIYPESTASLVRDAVAPFTGAWIEIAIGMPWRVAKS